MRWHINKILSLSAMIVVAILVTVLGCAPGAKPPAEKKPIVIGYVGNMASPGTKPDIQVIQMAVDEINAAGGVLGRPLQLAVEDGKGETGLSVDAATRLVMDRKVFAYFVEGRSEINFATIEASAPLQKDYPHIYICDGAMSEDITNVCIDKGYEWVFRAWDPEPTHYCWIGEQFTFWRDVIGARKVALLWEDLAWTKLWRTGDPARNLPTWADLAKKYGLEVVYNKPLKARYGNYLPIFEEASRAGAQLIFYCSSWFTDTEVFAKQWVESPAKDIPLALYGGIHQNSKAYWAVTGGTALGVTGVIGDYKYPFTKVTVPFVEKCEANNIAIQWQPHFSYATVYHLKKAIEKAGGTDDINRVIKAMTEVETEFGLGVLKFESQRIKPFYHSRVMADPKDPFKAIPGMFAYVIGQYQLNGEWVPLWQPSWSVGYPKLHQPTKYKSPAELRKMAGK